MSRWLAYSASLKRWRPSSPSSWTIKSSRRRAAYRSLSNLATIKDASEGLRAGQITPADLLQKCLQRQVDTAGLNAFVTPGAAPTTTSTALSGAFRLKGIPVAVKDNFCTKGVRTTAGSRMLSEFTPPYSATVVERLEAAGAVMMGKTNMDEFGMGSATIFSHFGETISPWSDPGGSLRLVAGGSSGGSAAAVASGSCLAAIGSDTGGSVRQPAAYCGLVGLKPTYGRVSRHGLIAYASSLDTPGVLARSVMDAAIVLDTIAGPDERDSTCSTDKAGEEWAMAMERWEKGGHSLRGLRVGVPHEFRVKEMDDAIVSAWEEGARLLKEAGAEVVEVSIPSVPLALPAYCVIACAEAVSNLARYDGVRYGYRSALAKDAGGDGASIEALADQGALHAFYTRNRTEGFGPEVQRRLLTGSFVLSAQAYSAYYEKARAARHLLRKDFDQALNNVDALLTPTTPTGPFPVGQPAEPASLLLNDIMTVPASLAGLPAISVPVGLTPSVHDPTLSVPTGLQVIGRRGDEMTTLRVAGALERQAKFEVPETLIKAKWLSQRE